MTSRPAGTTVRAISPEAALAAGPMLPGHDGGGPPAARHRVLGRLRARRYPVGIVAGASIVAVVLVLPLVFLLIEARGAGVARIWDLMARALTAQLLWNTVRLTVVVTILCAVVGTAAAWLVERTDLPGRRVLAVLLVVPLAIPDFVVSFGWASISPWIGGFRGAVIVMTLAVYPLVYLPVAASFRNADPAQEEVARSLGASRWTVLWRVTLGQARLAVLGGCLLVALVILAEYGAFEILGYQTFTTEIFTELTVSFNVPTASALSLVLVAVGLVVLAGEALAQGRGRSARQGPMARRMPARRRLGRGRLPALAATVLLCAAALGVPVGTAVYWMLEGPRPTIAGASLLDAAWHTAAYGVVAGALATAMALPVTLLALRHRGALSRVLERTSYLVLAMPGIVIALALSYFTERYLGGFLYQSAALLVLAYAILFFPLALVGVRTSLAQAPVSLEEVARSLGQRRLQVLRRVTLPLIGPGLAAAFSLVFLSVVTELTATLVLVPTGVQTLSTQFWAYEQNLSYSQAAPFALVMIGVAAVPTYVLGRFFDRLPSRRTAAP